VHRDCELPTIASKDDERDARETDGLVRILYSDFEGGKLFSSSATGGGFDILAALKVTGASTTSANPSRRRVNNSRSAALASGDTMIATVDGGDEGSEGRSNEDPVKHRNFAQRVRWEITSAAEVSFSHLYASSQLFSRVFLPLAAPSHGVKRPRRTCDRNRARQPQKPQSGVAAVSRQTT
jgi:hypothetical protein